MNIECITRSDYYANPRYDITLIHDSLLCDEHKPWDIPQYMPDHIVTISSKMQMEMQYCDLGYKRFSALGLNTKVISVISNDMTHIGKEISRGHPHRVAFWVPPQYANDIIAWLNNPISMTCTYLQSVMLAPPSQFHIAFVVPDCSTSDMICDMIDRHSLWHHTHRINISHDGTYIYQQHTFLKDECDPPYPRYDNDKNVLEMIIPSHDVPNKYDFVSIRLCHDDMVSDSSFADDWWNEIWNIVSKNWNNPNMISALSSDVKLERKSMTDVGFPISTRAIMTWMRWNDISSYGNDMFPHYRVRMQICNSNITHLWYRQAYRLWNAKPYRKTPLRILQNPLLHKSLVGFLESHLPKHDCPLRDQCCFVSENDDPQSENETTTDDEDVEK